VPSERGIPSELISQIILEWKVEYGPTFPLYGNETVRHDISGSVRPLLSSTELPHERILAEQSGVAKKTIQRIVSGDTKFVSIEVTDKLLQAMGKTDCWFVELIDYY
jgi:hypothetical protein